MDFCRSLVLIVMVASLTNFVAAHRQRMVCENVEERDGCLRSVGSVGRTGKAGPPGNKGEKGDRGSSGSPGIIDYARINNMIQEAIQATKEELSECNSKLADLEAKVMRNISLLQNGHCDVFYDGKCFVFFNPPRTITRDEASLICAEVGGKLANIYGRKHFEDIVTIIREKIRIGTTYANLWTGMSVDARRILHLSDGTPAPYSQWYPNRPYPTVLPNVGIHIDQTISSGNQGMFDERPTYQLVGTICEIEI